MQVPGSRRAHALADANRHRRRSAPDGPRGPDRLPLPLGGGGSGTANGRMDAPPATNKRLIFNGAEGHPCWRPWRTPPSPDIHRHDGFRRRPAPTRHTAPRSPRTPTSPQDESRPHDHPLDGELHAAVAAFRQRHAAQQRGSARGPRSVRLPSDGISSIRRCRRPTEPSTRACRRPAL